MFCVKPASRPKSSSSTTTAATEPKNCAADCRPTIRCGSTSAVANGAWRPPYCAACNWRRATCWWSWTPTSRIRQRPCRSSSKRPTSPACDLAIGSRYVAGGAVDPDWSWLRHINSKVATLLARGLTDVSDPMAGFFAIKRDTLAEAKVLRPLGYKILLELIVRCDCRRVVEIPIAFQDRELGESKLSLAQQWLYLRHLGRLYAARYLGTQTAQAPESPTSRLTTRTPGSVAASDRFCRNTTRPLASNSKGRAAFCLS